MTTTMQPPLLSLSVPPRSRQDTVLDAIEAQVKDKSALKPGWARIALFGHTIKYGFCEETDFLGERRIAVYMPQKDGTWVHIGTHGPAAIFEFTETSKRQVLKQLDWVQRLMYEPPEDGRGERLLPPKKGGTSSSLSLNEDDEDEDLDPGDSDPCPVCSADRSSEECDLELHLERERKLESELAAWRELLPTNPEAEEIRRKFAEGMFLPPDFPLAEVLYQSSFNQRLHFELEKELGEFERELSSRIDHLTEAGRVGGAHELRGLLDDLRVRRTRAQETSSALMGTRETGPAAVTVLVLRLIGIERRRQLAKYSYEHDDSHDYKELAFAAACYAAPKPLYGVDGQPAWPFQEPQPDCPRPQQLLRAAAMCAAELERLQRADRNVLGNPPVRTCRVCGCTEDDCRQCIAKIGEPCHWAEADLCSACLPPPAQVGEPRTPG